MAAPQIHPTAMVNPGAELGEDVIVGPYAEIEDEVVIGSGTEVGQRALIGRWILMVSHGKKPGK